MNVIHIMPLRIRLQYLFLFCHIAHHPKRELAQQARCRRERNVSECIRLPVDSASVSVAGLEEMDTHQLLCMFTYMSGPCFICRKSVLCEKLTCLLRYTFTFTLLCHNVATVGSLQTNKTRLKRTQETFSVLEHNAFNVTKQKARFCVCVGFYYVSILHAEK